ncbi:MAG TPA: RNA ligase (ATP) [Gordonia sp. (in: high G+C Gram-positive bacteria)]|uniref:RNA ligase (ATP) n=1 Tax=unclassified Gordonia (in: high G+C Gram-positive bacteria) TaxID=2657482 RepID=UPI000F9CAF95|nr:MULTISPECIES: RNA ligase (ATP) [unclassified Gordonia (in: high G+C Gram-positive bacteria)]RTL05840.1 MAG: RNA ligase (ATP) [Acidimicrobiia bacterium]HNP55753.1 RNA ligase (ATP) [Gordonia sp. (in: high G+C Gram-positive bacteria)]HRC49489.1 RNA ligase (ATP) [Gordonia sp. (in: high G+C Gram-positive bacteria)]
MTTPTSNDARRLVTIESIVAIEPIPGADSIEVARVRGWTVVVKKGEFAPGDPVVYIEVDAALPIDDPRFAFLAARGTKTLAGRDVHVLKTARLRGVYSQGIVFSLTDFPELSGVDDETGFDAALGVAKWEPPLPPGMAVLGPFPSHLQKTDAERVQNLDDETWSAIQADADSWLPTEKVDGTSLTAWRTVDGILHVAGRNWELDPATANVYWDAIATSRLDESVGVGEWVQAEVVGPGVQANALKLDALRVVAFGYGTFDAAEPSIATTVRIPTTDWPAWADTLRAPVYGFELPVTRDEAIAQVETIKSLISPSCGAEGVVWTHVVGTPLAGLGNRPVWKSISARYLTKHGG